MTMHDSVFANLKEIAGKHERIRPADIAATHCDFILEDKDQPHRAARGRIIYEYAGRPGYVLQIVKSLRSVMASKDQGE